MFSIWQKYGGVVIGLLQRRVAFAHRTDVTAGSRDPAQTVIVAAKEDDVVAIPCRPTRLAAERRQRLWRPAHQIDLLQIPLCRKHDVSTVRRPPRPHHLR